MKEKKKTKYQYYIHILFDNYSDLEKFKSWAWFRDYTCCEFLNTKFLDLLDGIFSELVMRMPKPDLEQMIKDYDLKRINIPGKNNYYKYIPILEDVEPELKGAAKKCEECSKEIETLSLYSDATSHSYSALASALKNFAAREGIARY